MSELIWDKGDQKHATQHGFSIQEIEEVFDRQPFLDPHEGAEAEEENQFCVYGTTAKGRYVTVACSERSSQFRPISAWPMTEEEFEIYADQIHYPRQSEDPEV